MLWNCPFLRKLSGADTSHQEKNNTKTTNGCSFHQKHPKAKRRPRAEANISRTNKTKQSKTKAKQMQNKNTSRSNSRKESRNKSKQQQKNRSNSKSTCESGNNRGGRSKSKKLLQIYSTHGWKKRAHKNTKSGRKERCPLECRIGLCLENTLGPLGFFHNESRYQKYQKIELTSVELDGDIHFFRRRRKRRLPALPLVRPVEGGSKMVGRRTCGHHKWIRLSLYNKSCH